MVDFTQHLVQEKNMFVDISIQITSVKGITSAQHYTYVENQYFRGSHTISLTTRLLVYSLQLLSLCSLQ
jgi:hypothetical protein